MEMGSPEKSFEELLDEYSSSADVEKALSEKQASLEEVDPINVKRDYPRPQDELDLHNFTGEEARRKTESYIRNSQRNKLKTIRIITGKGIHSENAKAVVRGIVSETVISLKKEGLVSDYEWESKTEQRSGAIIVYLASR
ncbi:Smr/MutS family protein [Candidatus Pacearchaeota archaeon]|nr:Smr/MutS family protein [Candidatus Pacearchaeota archaeon]